MLYIFQYRSLAPMYYRGSAAAIVVYDVTREVSKFIAKLVENTRIREFLYHSCFIHF